MNSERIRVSDIRTIEDARVVIGLLIDDIFVMKRDLQRQIDNLTSKNVKSLDFNITKVSNIEKILPKEGQNEKD